MTDKPRASRGDPNREGLSRRGFLALSGITSVVVLTGCGTGGDTFTPFANTVDKTTAWRLSTRNVSGASQAAKKHAANKRFVSAQAAMLNRAHAGDHSRPVPVDVKEATWESWFGGGADMIDLRNV